MGVSAPSSCCMALHGVTHACMPACKRRLMLDIRAFILNFVLPHGSRRGTVYNASADNPDGRRAAI